MSDRTEHDEERLARLLAALPPAPASWVEAAASLPAVRRDVEQIVALAEADQRFRRAAIADLETALRQRGYEPSARLLAAARQRLQDG